MKLLCFIKLAVLLGLTCFLLLDQEDREEILVIFTAAVILFQQDAKKLVHVMVSFRLFPYSNFLFHSSF